jgi:hypothetical protein
LADEKAEEKKKSQMEKAAGKEKYGQLPVTDLKMVARPATNDRLTYCPSGQHINAGLLLWGDCAGHARGLHTTLTS